MTEESSFDSLKSQEICLFSKMSGFSLGFTEAAVRDTTSL
jgi:hypothetical protein